MMSLLQKKPLVVIPSVFCNRERADRSTRLDAMADGTERFLKASLTMRPYAGLLIRRAAREQEVAEQIALINHYGPSSIEAQSMSDFAFEEPINKTMEQWWQTDPYATDFGITPLVQGHINRGSVIQDSQGYENGRRIPANGPVSGLLALKQQLHCRVGVVRKNFFKDGLSQRLANARPPLAFRYHEVTLEPGDFLAITNTPATSYKVQPEAGGTYAVYNSGFVLPRIPGVE